MAEQKGCLQGQYCSAVTHPSSSHVRCCLIRLSHDNRSTRYTAPFCRWEDPGRWKQEATLAILFGICQDISILEHTIMTAVRLSVWEPR
ncbi:hypothetical protein J6590_083081 [Homalodisca vitripennis]|nr:hypothetical protein J6590_083081 [Homalodisca vitripennis]